MERARRAGDHQGTRSTLATDWSISAGMARLFGSWRRRRDLSLPLDTSTSGITRHKLRPAATSRPLLRSEEHTSELQSLMRISYAVFCLKKKNNNQKNILHKIQ